MIGSTETAALQIIATRLGANYQDLYNLINFESGWNPKIKNKLSSARGLIQFTDETAKKLGYKNSADLVNKAPTIIDQLPIVEQYLMPMKPFPTTQSLFMAVFLPSHRNVSPSTIMPQWVRDANPGIITVADYIRKATGGKSVVSLLIPSMMISAGLIIYFLGKGRLFNV